MPRARRLQLTPQFGLPGEKQQPEGTLGKPPLSTSRACVLACDAEQFLRKGSRRPEKLDPVFRRERGDRGDLLLARRVAVRRKPVSSSWSASGEDEALEVTRCADRKPACVVLALDPIRMRHSLRSESDSSSFDPCRFVVTDEKAHLSLEHVPRLVIRLVKMKRRHVSRRAGELHYGHLTGHLLRQANAYEVREEPARLCFTHHCRQR
jgi:hypothetical protein